MTAGLLIGVLVGALLAGTAVAWWMQRRLRAMSPRASALPDPIAAMRLQMIQLRALHAEGALGDPQFDAARVGLEQRIVEAVLAAPSQALPEKAAAATPSRGMVVGLAAVVVVLAALGYWRFGTPQAMDETPAEAKTRAPGSDHPITSAQIESMVQKLEARLKESPNDAGGWAMLGRSYAMLGKHDLGAPALKKALSMMPDDAALIADYADALAVVNGNKLDGEPATLVAQALKIDPNNQKALSLAGTIAFNGKDYAGALRHWEKLAQIAPTSDYLQQIQSGIDEARQLLAGGGAKGLDGNAAVVPEPKTAAMPALSSISGTVTLATALAGKASPDDTLFVFARAAEGPRMPLAILRKQVKDLPLSFTLDDSLAMSPQMKLSSATRVVVGARISKRGDATAQPGDLQGLSAPLAPGAVGLKLEIKDTVGP